MTVKEHYDNHLGNFYAWMTGDFDKNVEVFQRFIAEHGLRSVERKKALDLGAGHGIQSIALSKLGYQVTSVDFNQQLLDELKTRKKGLQINVIQADILKYMDKYNDFTDLIVCWGDTLTHLEGKMKIEQFLAACSSSLAENGHIALSFRDYTAELIGDQRFIPVKCTDSRILTCVLEYEEDKVRVTDLLHEKANGKWHQQVSHYYKTRISPADVSRVLKKTGLHIIYDTHQQGVTMIIAKK